MTEEEAKKRFIVLNLVRLVSLAFVMVGIANIRGKIWPDMSPTLGYALLIIGAVDFFAAPFILKRYWQNRD